VGAIPCGGCIGRGRLRPPRGFAYGECNIGAARHSDCDVQRCGYLCAFQSVPRPGHPSWQ